MRTGIDRQFLAMAEACNDRRQRGLRAIRVAFLSADKVNAVLSALAWARKSAPPTSRLVRRASSEA
jgi:hypothetical protein